MKIKLSDTPLLSEFLKRLFELTKDINDVYDFENEFELLSRCQCGDSTCATIYIKGKTEFSDENLYERIFNTNKGLFIIHFEENAEIEIEALEYDDFPYKDEVERVFSGVIQEPSPQEMQKLDEYFENLEKEIMIVHDGSIE